MTHPVTKIGSLAVMCSKSINLIINWLPGANLLCVHSIKLHTTQALLIAILILI